MLSSGKDSSGKDRKIAFVIPGGVKHLSEIQAVIDLIKQYSESHGVALADIPQFHRMVTCYDIYIGCFEVVAGSLPFIMISIIIFAVSTPRFA